MKSSAVFILNGAVAVALNGYAAIAAEEAARPAESKLPAMQASSVPEPIAVTVTAVDPQAKTLTVRQVGSPSSATDVKLPVASNASGRQLGDIKAGDPLALTCEVKQTVPKKSAMAEETHPVLIKDCSKVVKIETTP